MVKKVPKLVTKKYVPPYRGVKKLGAPRRALEKWVTLPLTKKPYPGRKFWDFLNIFKKMLSSIMTLHLQKDLW